jgi:phosphoglycolate phosphatase
MPVNEALELEQKLGDMGIVPQHIVCNQIYPAHFPAGAPVTRVLDALAADRRLAVLSNKPHDLTVVVVQQLLGAWPFTVVHGQHPERPRKPDPGSIQSVCGELAIPLADAVLIGDSEVDIATARAANMRGICVTWGLRDAASLRAAGPEFAVDTPAELGALLT